VAHVGGAAIAASDAMGAGAEAYATGNHPEVKTVDRATLTAKDHDLDAGTSHVVT